MRWIGGKLSAVVALAVYLASSATSSCIYSPFRLLAQHCRLFVRRSLSKTLRALTSRNKPICHMTFAAWSTSKIMSLLKLSCYLPLVHAPLPFEHAIPWDHGKLPCP
ncbi:hypothetical protein D3C85_1306600 [compost metagenome]